MLSNRFCGFNLAQPLAVEPAPRAVRRQTTQSSDFSSPAVLKARPDFLICAKSWQPLPTPHFRPCMSCWWSREMQPYDRQGRDRRALYDFYQSFKKIRCCNSFRMARVLKAAEYAVLWWLLAEFSHLLRTSNRLGCPPGSEDVSHSKGKKMGWTCLT
jgi:hypothetical protein